MAFDAKIIGATSEKNGACWISLEPVERFDMIGRLWIANPPADGNAIGHLVECEVSIYEGMIGIGNSVIAQFISDSVIRLEDGWVEVADEWTRKQLEKDVA